MAILDFETSAVWAVLCILVFASLRSAASRTLALLIAPLPFLGLAAWTNSSAIRELGGFSVLLPTIVLVATVGGLTALLSNRLNAAWSKRAAS